MTLSEAISIAIKNEGIAVVGKKKIVNYLSDLYAFDTPAIKRIISILVDEKYLVPIKDIGTKADKELFIKNIGTQLIQKEGFQPHLVNFVIESLLSGTQNRIGPSSLPEKNGKNALPFYANLYHYFGMNITHIQGIKKNWYKYDRDTILRSFKNSTDSEWERLLNIEQDLDYINNQNWNTATGIGIVTGYKQLRALDFDYLDILDKSLTGGESLKNFVSKVLDILGLPGDYPWVTRSGSGFGLHFIFRCDDYDDFNNKVVAFLPSPEAEKNGDGFERLELRWSGHLVMPPSHSVNYYNDNFFEPLIEHYRFYSGKFPNYAPQKIDIDKVNNLLNHFSSTISCMNVIFTDSGNARIIGHKKMTTRITSDGDNIEFEPSEKWAKSCISNDNEEYALFLLTKDFGNVKPENLKKAVEILKKSDTSISHYNMASLMANGIISGNKAEALRHFAIVQNSKEISPKDINNLKYDIDHMK